MQISTTKRNLPQLPQPPNDGRGRLEVDLTYEAPDTIETRLGSIPADYESWTGWERTERIYFRDGHKEASNPYGRSQTIWRAQPTYNQDGSARLKEVTRTIVAEPKSELTTPLLWGAGAGLAGGIAGAVVGLATGTDPGVGAVIGAGLGAVAGGVYGYHDANTDRVRLEWQETNITEKDLVGYIHDVDEDRRYVCHGYGKDRHCRWETDDYEHDFRPIIESTVVGTYHRPVVVHYKN